MFFGGMKTIFNLKFNLFSYFSLNCFSLSGKKGGKKKGQTLNLTDFLGGDAGGTYKPPGSGATTTVAVGSNWADEMDEEGFEGGKSRLSC